MPLLWCSISGHGLGHAAQMLPVLNELGRRVPGLTVRLRTTVPAWFFQDRLDVPWVLSPVEQDIGCVQQGPLHIDVVATWRQHGRFHEDWERRVAEEAQAIRSGSPDLVVSNISYLAIEASARAQVPAVGLCSLSWDQILEPLIEGSAPVRRAQAEIIGQIRRAYGMADMMLRPAPGLLMNTFRKIVDIGPIAQPPISATTNLQRLLGAAPDEVVVLIGFGGIALDSLPYERLEQINPYRFIVTGSVPGICSRIRSAASLGIPFRSLLASTDLLVTKPGYSTVIEAVAHSRPVVYVRRYNFADEEGLVQYLHRYGRAVELSMDDFLAGGWQKTLDAALTLPPPREPAPALSGAAEAAAVLATYL